MITKRIIPCLDVKEDKVVKGVQFKNHKIVGSILDLAEKYSDEGADELVYEPLKVSPRIDLYFIILPNPVIES